MPGLEGTLQVAADALSGKGFQEISIGNISTGTSGHQHDHNGAGRRPQCGVRSPLGPKQYNAPIGGADNCGRFDGDRLCEPDYPDRFAHYAAEFPGPRIGPGDDDNRPIELPGRPADRSRHAEPDGAECLLRAAGVLAAADRSFGPLPSQCVLGRVRFLPKRKSFRFFGFGRIHRQHKPVRSEFFHHQRGLD